MPSTSSAGIRAVSISQNPAHAGSYATPPATHAAMLEAALLMMHEHADDLAKDESGAILYRTSDDKVLRLKPGKDKLIIEDAEDDE